MAEAHIPVDLFNPGQVFACLGFLEAADVLLGGAEGGFDWSQDPDVSFRLRAAGDEDPFPTVLSFLVEAQLRRLAPTGYSDPSRRTKQNKRPVEDEASADARGDGPVCMLETFPGPQADWKALPIRLERGGRHLDVTHWCDASSRKDFKLFAGQQRGPAIAKTMLQSVARLWSQRREQLVTDPFSETVAMGGSSFKFDARKAWTGMDAGYSPDEQKHAVAASSVVEFLSAVGLEHARPHEFAKDEVCYAVWRDLVPPVLARPALAGAGVGLSVRRFRFTFARPGKGNRLVTFAQEEANP